MQDLPSAPPSSAPHGQPAAERPVGGGPSGFFRWPSVAASILLLALTGCVVGTGMARNHGKWIYPLDDAYIHMAAAKQLGLHGVWGISRLNGFSSCLSSLFYPPLMAGSFLLFGLNEFIPLALNLIASVAAVCYAGALLRRYSRSTVFTFIVLALAVIYTPLFIVAATGMEHTWQILIDLLFADLALRVLSQDEPASSARRAGQWLPLASCLAVMVRFEGLFFVTIVGLLLLCRGRFWLAVGVGVGAALPLGIFGAYSVSKGWSFLPNSVLLKGGNHSMGPYFLLLVAAVFAGLRWPRSVPRVLALGVILVALIALFPPSRAWVVSKYRQNHEGYRSLLRSYAHLIVLVACMTAALYWQLQRRRTLWTSPTLLLCILLVVALQHMAFAGVGWVFRYEAYLMFLGIVALGVAFADAYPEPAAAWAHRSPGWVFVASLVVVLLCLPLTRRAVTASIQVPQASHNIYEQQYQMARFVRRFYDDDGVAANDIGAIDYFADLRLLDTWGLASHEVYEAKRAGTFDPATLQRLTRKYDVHLVVVYDSWASNYGGNPSEWVPVGRWKIPNNVICGDDTVSFYAPDASLVPRLTDALREFAPQLPSDVVQSGDYAASLHGAP